MKLIYSDVPPLKIPDGSYSLASYFYEKLEDADTVYCAVGYVSKKSLIELDRLIREKRVSRTVLVLGMYCVEGFPESIYNTAVKINQGWHEDGIGEIRAVKSMKYHGKVYGFYKNGSLFSASVGSHNLSALAADASTLRQYELSMHTEDPDECSEISEHLEKLVDCPVSFPLEDIKNIKIIHEENTKLHGVEGVTKVSPADVYAYKSAETDISFEIPLKVPGIPGDSKNYMKSNINKCYAKGRENKKTGVVAERGWWETEIIVSKSITSSPRYPEADVPFFVVTDDGWKFLMHVSGDYKKNLESDGDLKIMGYWLKGRLAAAGIVDPVDSPSADLANADYSLADAYRNCKGVITYGKLAGYGRTSVTLTKTLNMLADDKGIMREVWVLSFLPEDVQ